MSNEKTAPPVMEPPVEEKVEVPVSDADFMQDWASLNGPLDSREIICRNVWDNHYRVNWFGPAFFDPIVKSLFVTLKGEGDEREVFIHERQ